jgi:hypothetical protein
MADLERREVLTVTVERRLSSLATQKEIEEAFDVARKELADAVDPWKPPQLSDGYWSDEVRLRAEGDQFVVYFVRPTFGPWETTSTGPPPDEPVPPRRPARQGFTDDPPF